MQTNLSNIWTIKEEPESNIVVLDDAVLDEANGGIPLVIPPAVVAGAAVAGAAAAGFVLGVGVAFGVAWLVSEVF